MNDINAAKANWLIAGTCLVALIWLAAVGYEDKNSRRHKSTKTVKSFTRHSDTLTVIDADGLNQAATYCDGTDGEINEMLHQYCK